MQAKEALVNARKDPRYKYIVQTTVGENNGQGMKVQSRCCWDEDSDDVAYVSYRNDAIFVVVIAFAVYLYWVALRYAQMSFEGTDDEKINKQLW